MKRFEQPAAHLVATGGTPLSRRQFLAQTLGVAGFVRLREHARVLESIALSKVT